MVYDGLVGREETPTLAASRSSGRAARASLAWAAWLLALALVPLTAEATTVDSLTTSVSTTQAGQHADLSVSFSLGASGDPETVKELDLGLPPGLFLAQFLSGGQLCAPEEFDSSECPNVSQVGLITIHADYAGDPSYVMGIEPVYLLKPTAEEHARLGFTFPIVRDPVEIPVRLRTGSDYGLDLAPQELPPSAPVTSAELSLWGVPGDPSHDTSRPLPGECAGLTGCVTPPRPPGSQPLPFLTNPTRCGAPLQVMLALSTYEQPDVVVSSAASMATTTGCHLLPFGPELQVALTSAETSSASGISLDLRLPGSDGVDVLEPAAVRWLGLELPPGFSVDQAAAAALGVCTDAQFGLDTDEPATCPAASRVGTISLEVEGFDAPLEGEAFFGTALSDAYRILLDASGSGGRVKLEVLLEPEFEGLPPILEFSELPQIPIRDLELSLEKSTGLLVTAPTSGTHLAEGEIESWSGSVVASSHPLTLSSGPDEDPVSEPPNGHASSPPTSPVPTPPPPRRPLQPPVATITTDPPERTTRPKMKLKFASDGPGSIFECKLDKAPWRHCASPKTVGGLAPGKHVFRVRAIDAAGNRGPSDRVIWRVVFGQRRPSGSPASSGSTGASSSSGDASSSSSRRTRGAARWPEDA